MRQMDGRGEPWPALTPRSTPWRYPGCVRALERGSAWNVRRKHCVPRANPSLFLDDLVCLGKLARGSAALIEQLRNLRNQATHLLDFGITQEEADI